MHEFTELDNKGLRKFGLITGAIVVVLFGFLLPWLLDRQWPIWPWVISSGLWAPALLFPAALRPIYRGWMRFGAVLGFINTRIILTIVFFMIIMPIGFVMRLFRHDPMRRDSGDSISYRVTSQARPTKNMERPY